MIYSGKIKTAYYTNSEFTIICVEWNDGKKNRKYHIENNPDTPEYKALVADGWNEQKIIEGTVNYRKFHHGNFAKIVHKEVEQRVSEIMKTDNVQVSYDERSIDHSTIWDQVTAANENKDDVFAFKIWAFEIEAVKGASPEDKRELRKATTLLDSISTYNKIISK